MSQCRHRTTAYRWPIAITWGLAGILAWGQAPAAEEAFSRANTLLFLSDHLANVEQPTTLRYTFENSGPDEEGFADTIDVRVVDLWPDGSKHVEMDYFSGERNRTVPSVEHARGNPVVMLFLQRDVMEMARRASHSWRYFQKQIKIALQDRARVSDIQMDFAGRRIPATTITIQPYLDTDGARGSEHYRTKTYRFTLSQDIPGTIYEIRSVSDPEQPPMREATLTYTPTAISSRPIQSSTR